MARDVSDETKVKWRRLLQRIRLATDEQKITWDRTALESAFVTTLGSYVILLEKQEDDQPSKYTIKLQDGFGDLIDEFDDVDLDDNPFESQYLSFMANLYLKIRRQISGADAAINEVLAELDKLDDIPF